MWFGDLAILPELEDMVGLIGVQVGVGIDFFECATLGELILFHEVGVGGEHLDDGGEVILIDPGTEVHQRGVEVELDADLHNLPWI